MMNIATILLWLRIDTPGWVGVTPGQNSNVTYTSSWMTDVIYKLLGWINDQLWFLTWLLCLIVFLRWWYQLITARWEDKAIKDAKNKMIWAWVGMLLVLLSYAIVKMVVNFL